MTDILKLLEPAGENATDDIIRQIRFLLDSGDLQPGDKLPAERKLAEKFQVARSQVREAFKKLEFYNIIKTMPQSGSVISAIESTALNSLISDILKMDKEVYHMQGGKKIRLSRPQQLMAAEREIIEEAYAGDIIGVFDPGIFSIGDTLCAPGKKFTFDPIPTFAPEHFERIRSIDTMKRKQFLKGQQRLFCLLLYYGSI